MSESVDTNSIVFVEDSPQEATPSGIAPGEVSNKPTQTILIPIDYNSIKIGDMPMPQNETLTVAPPKPTPWQNIRILFQGVEGSLPPGKSWGSLSKDEKLGVLDRQAIDKKTAIASLLRESPEIENAKAMNIDAISSMSGVPRTDIEKHYDDIKFLSSVSGIEPDQPSVETLAGAAMTAALIPPFVANPVATVGGLIAFGALDTMFPTDKFIPEGASRGAKDTIKLIGLVAKGAIVGGMLEAVPKTSKDFPALSQFLENPQESVGRTKSNFVEIFKKWTQQKLEEKGLPAVVPITPEQLDKIKQIDNPSEKTPAEIAAEGKRLRKIAIRKENTINDLQDKIYNRQKLGVQNYPDEWLIEAKQRVLQRIDTIEKTDGKLRSGLKQMRFQLNKDIEELNATIAAKEPEPVTILEKLGIDKKTEEVATANNLTVPVDSEKLVDVALGSESQYQKVQEILSEQKAVEGTGAIKTRGLAAGVEAKAIENKLTKGFGELPEYRVVNMEDQALKATELLNSDYEKALRIAMGEERPPADILPEAVFVAIENRAIKENDVSTIRDLATRSSLTTEATTMGQRIRTLAERDPESPMGAMKEVMRLREERARRRLKGKKNLEAEIEKNAGEIKKEIQKVKHTKQTWEEFINEIMC